MYFATAGIEVNPLIPPLVALGVSFFTSMGGVSGAFLLLPFQVSALGYTSPSVSATNQVFNIVATPGGIYRYLREKRLLWPLAALLLMGTLPGVFFGALIRLNMLRDPAFLVFVALVLLFLGLKLLLELRGKKSEQAKEKATLSGPGGIGTATKAGQDVPDGGNRAGLVPQVSGARLGARRLEFDFGARHYSLSSLGLFLISLLVGLVGGIYGIGGGAIISPLLVSLYALPVHAIGGACLLSTFGTSVAGVCFYSLLAPWYPELGVAPDLALGGLFGLGGLAGSYLGARCQKFVPAPRIKLGLALVILFAAGKSLYDFLSSFS